MKNATMPKTGVDNPKLLLLAKCVAAAGILYHIYSLMIRATSPGYIRPIHVCFLVIMAYLVAPKPGKKKGTILFWWIADTVLVCGVIASTVYIFIDQQSWMMRYAISSTDLDFFFSTVTAIAILVMAQRLVGWPMVLLAGAAMVYCLFGHYLSGSFRILQITPRKMMTTMYFMQDGFFSSLIGVCLSYVLPFVFVGKLMELCGTGDYFTELAAKLTGRSRGGPAKVAIVSSALFGTVSGAGTANVVATGTFTIPLMKRIGYPSHFAAAVEAVASTGGQIMPPIMASAAFLAADLSGIPYGQLAIAAVIPALIYYVSLYFSIDLEAGRLSLKAMDADDIVSWGALLKRAYLLLPLAIIIVVLTVLQQSPLKGAFYAMICGCVIYFINPKTRKSLKEGLMGIVDAMYQCASAMAGIGAAFLCASIVVAVLNMTGIAVKFSSAILQVGQGSVLLSLILTAAIVTVLGMGLPVAASYVIAASVCVNSLLKLGIPMAAAHLFILHFASLSALTPPVCLSAYAAAGISGDSPMKVGFTSVRIGLVAFLLPFFFAINPDMLVIINGAGPALRTCVTALIGCAGISFATIGWYRHSVSVISRVVFLIGGLLMIDPSLATDVAGLGVLTVTMLVHLLTGRRKRAAEKV
ncbi:TRAP transporter fused permease subunit [Oscillibacter hominis]|uniref:TRAP transporter fused permease subunit n=1 Tax=Oscillibacter hominis TaxID=2763056 RepID=A0A7G9B6Y1_9FIRM|nr:TRAP transporter fused permease subunit [Oscillibacter hominis]QNL45312.1 TRAP transporter fused permease subunit [Oscillibacter hominis]